MTKTGKKTWHNTEFLFSWSLLYTHQEAGGRERWWSVHMSRKDVKSEFVLYGIFLLSWENETHVHT